MYHHCIYCQADLGTNDLLEEFPIGTRLAFDPTRGRLWAVCRGCERWNLTPLEERWEAVEACERLFRATRLRISTTHIGLARVPPGLDLVRIGDPLRPEMAAWRYGDQFGRRRRRHLILSGATLLLVPTVFVSASLALGLTGVGGVAWQLGSSMRSLYRRQHVVGVATLPSGRKIPLTPHIASTAALRRRTGGTWTLDLPRKGLLPQPDLQFGGDDALAVARSLLPIVNRAGASRRDVTAAVRRLEYVPDLEYWLTTTADNPPAKWADDRQHQISRQPADLRLALEMLLHEDLERRSLEGELWRLERAWQSAEEVAAIADGLLVSDDIEAKIKSLGSSARRTP